MAAEAVRPVSSASRGTLVQGDCRGAGGREVCIFYGPRPNAELLCYSGFVYPSPSNSYDRAQVSWELSSEGHPNPKLLKKQLMILKNIPDVAVGTRNDGRTYRVVATVLAPRARHSGGEYAQAHEKAAAGEEGDGVETGLAATGTALSAALRASCIKESRPRQSGCGRSSHDAPPSSKERAWRARRPAEVVARVALRVALRAARRTVSRSWNCCDASAPTAWGSSARRGVRSRGLAAAQRPRQRRPFAVGGGEVRRAAAKLHAESPHTADSCDRSSTVEPLDSVAAFAAEAAGGGGAAVNTN